MKLGKRVTGLLLAACLAVGMAPTMAFAEDTNKTIMLGTSGIGNPSSSGGGWSYVYFGTYNNSPVKYRVLDNETTVFSKDENGSKAKTMLLDCDSVLWAGDGQNDSSDSRFDKDGTTNEEGKNANDWSCSDIKTYLNGSTFLENTNNFSKVEQAAIASSTKTEAYKEDSDNGKDGDGVGYLGWEPLTGEKIFLLDAKEATNTSYGYSNDDSRKKTGGNDSWWLRSPSTNYVNNAGAVYSAGGINDYNVYYGNVGVSPALNINLSSVLFSSEISNTNGKKEYKLTLIDDKLQIALGGDVERSVDSANGDTITVPYTISGDNRNNATQISMLITDKEYAPGNANGAQKVYYGAMENVSQTSGENENNGTAQIKLTSELSANISNYHVYIIAEDVNGEKETDYASNPVEITFSKDEPAKTDTDNSNNSSSNTDNGSTSTETTVAETVKPAPITITYTVKKDDYMKKIAREHGITLEQLIALNPQVKNPNLIYAGQVLVISTTGSTVSTAEITATKTYTVQRGDSLYKIARKNGMTLAELKSLNENLFAQKYIYAGQAVLLK